MAEDKHNDAMRIDVEPEFSRAILQLAGDVVERVVAVDFGLARAEQVQVRAVENEDGFAHRVSLPVE